MTARNNPMPKTENCKACGLKPKREIVAWGYGDSNDEFFLVHRCLGKHVSFPENDTFSSFRFEYQERKVVDAWNEAQKPAMIQESEEKGGK